MRRILVSLTALLLAVSLWADDPWKSKPYTDWSEEVARKVLNNSPWAKETRVDATWRGTSGSSGSGGAEIPGAAGAPGRTAADTSAGGPTTAGAASVDSTRGPQLGDPISIPQAIFLVRWGSALTMRQAVARLTLLRGGTEANVRKLIEAQPAEYQVVVAGQDMTPFTEVEEKELQEKSFLQAKRSKLKLSSSRVEITRSPDGKRVVSVSFFFPKATPSGEPTLAPDEKGVEFTAPVRKNNLKCSFDLQKMSGPQGRDL